MNKRITRLAIAFLLLFGISTFEAQAGELVKFISPLDDRFPSAEFTTKVNEVPIRHLIDALKDDEQIRQMEELFQASTEINPDAEAKSIFIAVYEKPSPYGVPFMQCYSGHGFNFFNLDDKKMGGMIFHLSIVDPDGNKKGVETGVFQSGFFHEIGHIILHNLVPNYPTAYQSNGITSLSSKETAFDEGFAELHEIFFEKRMPQYGTPNFLAAYEQFLYKMEFACFRPFGTEHNLFVWADWNDWPRLSKILKEKGGEAFYQDDFLSKKELREFDDMIRSEGVVATLFLALVGEITTQENGAPVDLQKCRDWNKLIKPAFLRLYSTIHSEQNNSLEAFVKSLIKDPSFEKYRSNLWKVILETTFYAFGSEKYGEMYRNFHEGRISESEYSAWKNQVFHETAGL